MITVFCWNFKIKKIKKCSNKGDTFITIVSLMDCLVNGDRVMHVLFKFCPSTLSGTKLIASRLKYHWERVTNASVCMMWSMQLVFIALPCLSTWSSPSVITVFLFMAGDFWIDWAHWANCTPYSIWKSTKRFAKWDLHRIVSVKRFAYSKHHFICSLTR